MESTTTQLDQAGNNQKENGIMDWDEYNQQKQDRKEKNLQNSLDVLQEASALATKNGLELVQHNHWHFSLTCYRDFRRIRRYNMYPSSQRIWIDETCGLAPYLKLPNPWNLLDVVKEAVSK